MGFQKILGCFLGILLVVVLSSCGSDAANSAPQAVTILEMELTENYDTSDPFIHEKLFCVSEDVDTLELHISLVLDGESGLVEVADNGTKELLWDSGLWNGHSEINAFTVALESLDRDKDYVVRFTGTDIAYAKVVVTSASGLVSELERPRV